MSGKFTVNVLVMSVVGIERKFAHMVCFRLTGMELQDG